MFVNLGNLHLLISKSRNDRHCRIKKILPSLLHKEKEMDDVLILLRKGIYRKPLRCKAKDMIKNEVAKATSIPEGGSDF